MKNKKLLLFLILIFAIVISVPITYAMIVFSNKDYSDINYSDISTKDYSDISDSTFSINTIVREGICPMSEKYQYSENDHYPLIVQRRMKDNLELIKFPNLPSEDEFIEQATIDEVKAREIIQDVVIVFTDNVIPTSTTYNYTILNENIESIELITTRTHYCNNKYSKGSIDSNIRVVWKVMMKESHYKETIYKNKEYWYNWNIYVDAVTGEIVYISQTDVKNERYIPNWDPEFDLKPYNDEYIQLDLYS